MMETDIFISPFIVGRWKRCRSLGLTVGSRLRSIEKLSAASLCHPCCHSNFIRGNPARTIMNCSHEAQVTLGWRQCVMVTEEDSERRRKRRKDGKKRADGFLREVCVFLSCFFFMLISAAGCHHLSLHDVSTPWFDWSCCMRTPHYLTPVTEGQEVSSDDVYCGWRWYLNRCSQALSLLHCWFLAPENEKR